MPGHQPERIARRGCWRDLGRGGDQFVAEVGLLKPALVVEVLGGPLATTRPLSMTVTWSAIASACSASCSTSRIVMPWSLRSRMRWNTSSTIAGARPAEGSSSSSTRGRDGECLRDREHLLLAAGQAAGGLAARALEHRELLEHALAQLAALACETATA